MKRFFLFFFLTFLFSTIGSSQTYKSIKGEGDDFFHDEYYELAVDRYKECHIQRPTDYTVSYNLGIAYLLLNKIRKAEEFLQTVYDNKSKQFPDVVYYLGYMHQRNLQFRKAAKLYKEYLSFSSKGKHANYVKHHLRNCEYGMLQKNRAPIAAIKNLAAPINSPYNDFHPIYSPNAQMDRIYFSSNRIGVLGGLRNKEGNVDNIHGHRKPDMFVVSRYSLPELKHISGLLNTSLFDEVMGFSYDGQRMYYKKGYSQHAGLLYEDEFTKTDRERIASRLVDVPFDMSKGDATPFFFIDSVVYFASRDLGGFGGYDIFASTKTADGWDKPINLGAGINSAYDDMHPFMTNNKRSLYFSSNRPTSIGGFDIFKSEFSPVLRRWNRAQNMGIPINSADNDLYFQMADDGWHFILSSNRKESMGLHDIFEGTFYEQQAEQVVMAKMVEQEKNMDTTAIQSISVLFQKYPLGAVIPSQKQFKELQSLSELVNQYEGGKLILNINMTTSNTNGLKERLDPLSDVLISYLTGNLEKPINVTRRLLAPKETFEPGTFVEALIVVPVMNKIEPINAVKKHAFVPRISQGLRYKIEVTDNVGFDKFLLKAKYDFSFNLWPEEDEQIHILYREFLTLNTAKQWVEQLEENHINVKRIIPFYNGIAIDQITPEILSEFPELIEFFNEEKGQGAFDN